MPDDRNRWLLDRQQSALTERVRLYLTRSLKGHSPLTNPHGGRRRITRRILSLKRGGPTSVFYDVWQRESTARGRRTAHTIRRRADRLRHPRRRGRNRPGTRAFASKLMNIVSGTLRFREKL